MGATRKRRGPRASGRGRSGGEHWRAPRHIVEAIQPASSIVSPTGMAQKYQAGRYNEPLVCVLKGMNFLFPTQEIVAPQARGKGIPILPIFLMSRYRVGNK